MFLNITILTLLIGITNCILWFNKSKKVVFGLFPCNRYMGYLPTTTNKEVVVGINITIYIYIYILYSLGSTIIETPARGIFYKKSMIFNNYYSYLARNDLVGPSVFNNKE